MQAGLMSNKSLTDRAQKTSLYGWFGGSLCTIVLELYELAGGRGGRVWRPGGRVCSCCCTGMCGCGRPWWSRAVKAVVCRLRLQPWAQY